MANRMKGKICPGFLASSFGANNGGIWRVLRKVLDLIAISVEEGAQTSIYLATSPEVEGVTGRYFYKKQAIPSSPASYNEETAAKLWQVSEQLTGI